MIARPAKREDISFIIGLEEREEYRPFITLESEEAHVRHMEDAAMTLAILEEAGKRVGFFLSRYEADTQVYELRRLAVTERGVGLGREAILLAFEDAFVKRGAERLWLDVYENNERGIALYRRMGMTHEGIFRSSDIKMGKRVNQWIFSLLREEYDLHLEFYKKLCNTIMD